MDSLLTWIISTAQLNPWYFIYKDLVWAIYFKSNISTLGCQRHEARLTLLALGGVSLGETYFQTSFVIFKQFFSWKCKKIIQHFKFSSRKHSKCWIIVLCFYEKLFGNHKTCLKIGFRGNTTWCQQCETVTTSNNSDFTVVVVTVSSASGSLKAEPKECLTGEGQVLSKGLRA